MKRLSIILILLATYTLLPAKTLKDLFKEMPDSLCLINKEGRLDCIDFLSSNMKANTKNHFGETATLVSLTENYGLLQVSHSSQIELKLLFNGKDSIICAIHTYMIPTKESLIEFYNTHWKIIKTDKTIFKKPTAKDFIKASTKEEIKAIQSRIGTECIEIRLSEKSDTLTCNLNCYEGNTDLKTELFPFLLEHIEFVWQNGIFQKLP